MKILKLTLQKAPFEVMASGEKLEEFRRLSPWIMSRLVKDGDPVAYDYVQFFHGPACSERYPNFKLKFLGFEFSDYSERQYSNGLRISLTNKHVIIKMAKEGDLFHYPSVGEAAIEAVTAPFRPLETEPVTDEAPVYFDLVLSLLRLGYPCRRASWPEGDRIVLIPGSEFNVTEGRPLAAAIPAGEKVTYSPHIDMVSEGNCVRVYTLTTEDLLASDWTRI